MKKYFHLSLFMLILSCQPVQQPINFGKDGCAFCKMIIVDRRFGAELLTTKGKVYKFDSVECLIHFIRGGNVTQENIKMLLVINAAEPGSLISTGNGFYLHSEKFPSPMGANVSAFGSLDQLSDFKNIYDGEVWTWQELNEKLTDN